MPAASRSPLGGDDVPTAAVGFHTTHWTVLIAAQQERTSDGEALAKLCSSYWHPVYAFIRRTGASPHEAEDLTQEFFYRILQRDWLADVHPAGGKFRSYVLVCVKNFLSNERDKVMAQRRGGGRNPLPLERQDAETRYLFEPPDPLTPEVVFERRWVYQMLERTLEALRQEYARTNRLDWFEDLQGFLPGGREVASRPELAQKRGVSANAIDVAIHRLRQRFGVLLRAIVAETVASEQEVDDEIRHLMSVLSG